MKDLHIIACNRRAVLTDNEAKIFKATLDKCPMCGEEMWLTPTKQEAMKLLRESGEAFVYCCWLCINEATKRKVKGMGEA